MEAVVQLSPVSKAFLAGSLSGACSTLLFQPLDLVKTRQQAWLAAPGRPGPAAAANMLAVTRGILATSNFTGLWRGVLPSMCRTVPGVGLYFSTLHQLRSRVRGRPSALQTLLMGASARALAAAAIIPFTVLKTRYESEVFRYRSVGAGLRAIVRAEGGRGLVRGLAPTLARDVPFSGLYLALYEALKASSPAWLAAASPAASHLLAGLGAGVLASLATHPADVVKTRMQLAGWECQGVAATVAATYRQAGPRGFLAGLGARLVRRTAMAAMAWTIYERMLATLSLK